MNFRNVKFTNISINSRTLLNIISKDIFIDGLEVENIVGSGDSSDSSLIIFDSNESHNKLEINDMKIKNCQTNGPLIKIKGYSNEVILKDASINNVTSYGPVIDNTSVKSTVNISNLIFTNNTNSNKNSCGNIHIQYQPSLSIQHSIFEKNINEGNGGALYV
ncbi:hypothetical protein PIROE2DRAFT_18167 [Piromyces sp. E2]|nr:hypothetical protein PIROE2DRAFT_18167 [Piromyces sp. E2]|eukprot:OUM56990.1 hypothetical protein PIROE2DRAFT_18167 [Piromyces sp. E2]